MDFEEIINTLRNAPRVGNDVDTPEGVRYIQLSDTLANKIADYLEDIELNILEDRN